MAKKQDVKIDELVAIKPITDNQKVAFEAFKNNNKELFLHGAAGTGKTFISLYLALEKVLDPSTPYHCVYLIRSAVLQERLVSCQEMKKTKLHCIRFHIRIWYNSCLNNLVTKHLQCCMID